MKINLRYDEKLGADEIVLQVSPENENAQGLIQVLSGKDADCAAGKIGEKIYLVDLNEIELFYSYDNGVMFSANGSDYKTNEKLFELEQKYGHKSFMRISKSVIVNIKKIEYLAPAFNKKLIFKLESGKEEYSSRTYYTKIKEKLGV